MIKVSTITRYLTYKFIRWLVLTVLVIFALLFITGAFDVIQKFKSTHFSPQEFWLLILLKLPYLFNEISTIIGLISTVLFLQSLVASNELIVILSSGVSIWRVFVIPIILSFSAGGVIVAIINPVSISSLREYEKIEARLQNKVLYNNFVVSNSGIFFSEKYQDTTRIMRAHSINAEKNLISDMSIVIIDDNNQLIKRIESVSVKLEDNKFKIKDPKIFTKEESLVSKDMQLPTNLSINNLIQSFVPPEMVSIWNLPESIKKMNNSGIPTSSYELYFFKQLFKPLTFVAMTFLAFWFLNLHNRSSNNTRNIIFSLMTGIVVYFLLEITLRALVYSGFSPMLASLLPLIVIILISNFVILHFQEA